MFPQIKKKKASGLSTTSTKIKCFSLLLLNNKSAKQLVGRRYKPWNRFLMCFFFANVVQHITQKRTDISTLAVRKKIQAATHRKSLEAPGSPGREKNRSPSRGTNRLNVFTQRTSTQVKKERPSPFNGLSRRPQLR